MNYREPDAGGPDQTTGLSSGEAVWENELPWQLAPLGETGQHGPVPAEEFPGHGIAARATGTAVSPAASDPALGAGTASAPHAPTTEAHGAGPESPAEGAPGGRRRRDRGDRTGSAGAEGTGDGRGRLRLALAKPVLAGAGMLSAVFLLAPTVFGDDTPAHTFKAGAGDAGEDYASENHYSGSDGGASPRPSASGNTSGKDGGPRRIAEVAAASPTRETRSVEPMSQSHAPAPSRTPHSSSTPRQQQSQSQPPQQHWTTATVNGTSVLEPGQSWSTNRIMLAFQGDGNLVLYDTKGTPLWWSGTVGRGAKAVFQADGNFAVYAQDGSTAWSSRTDGHDGAQLVLGANGNVTIRSGGAVLWSTGTAM
ncbi:hypothetical protein [Streptomyces naphthomycinicus]|uniref:hypothetical protein n=1 Tax=Streptomyces naphthomycinicus TaxID=2872625 RepID=UPI001CED6565|nr:hypothetical protein [Streptomyces sp. TML10]